MYSITFKGTVKFKNTSNKTICMFYEQIATKGSNLVANPKVYNVEGDNML